jgi:hypothetical protein
VKRVAQVGLDSPVLSPGARAQEGRDGDGDEDRDDQHDHHQLDQREAALPLPLEPAPQSLQHVRFLLLEAVLTGFFSL